jgi:hypothetical protein
MYTRDWKIIANSTITNATQKEETCLSLKYQNIPAIQLDTAETIHEEGIGSLGN